MKRFLQQSHLECSLKFLSDLFLWISSLFGSSLSEVFCKKGVFENFAKFIGKHLWQSIFINKVAGLRLATLLRKRLWHRWFPVNYAKFLRTPFIYRTPPEAASDCWFFTRIYFLEWAFYHEHLPGKKIKTKSVYIIKIIFYI